MAASDAFYNDIVAEVEPILAELGKTFKVRAPGAYDEATMTTLPPSERTVTGLVADQATALQFTTSDGARGHSSAWLGTKNLIMSAKANPKPSEEVEVDGRWFPFTKLVEIKPADVVVVYILDVTK